MLTLAAAAAPFDRDLQRSYATIAALIDEARAAGAGLLVLPEAALGGYVESLSGDFEPPPALDPDGPELRTVMELAKDMVVCVGFCEAGEDGARHNVAACVSRRRRCSASTARSTCRSTRAGSRRPASASPRSTRRSAGSGC